MFGKPLKTVLKDNKKFTLLQVGDTGHGKTTRALSATRFGPMFVFDFDKKLKAAARNADEKTLSLVSMAEYADFVKALSDAKALASEFDAGKKPFATICVDTYTALNELVYMNCLGKQAEAMNIKTDFSVWGNVAHQCNAFFNILLSLPCNLIVNTHVAKTETVDGKQALGIAGKGSHGNSLPHKMTDTHYLFMALGKWKIRALKSESLPANSSVDAKWVDSSGCLTTNSLEVFDNLAFTL